jgi:hypothetical protein
MMQQSLGWLLIDQHNSSHNCCAPVVMIELVD